ncbi:alpha/beta hydrolase [soil metagenome]
MPGRLGLPTDERPTGPPPKSGLFGELRGVTQLPALLLRSPRLRRMPRGAGQPVILVPGWRAPEASMLPLRRYLNWLGYDARAWGLGTHYGDPEGDSRRLAPRVRTLSVEAGQPVHLIGWSLGGVIARETARALPRHVAQVITFGSPIIGGPVYTSVAGTVSPQRRQHFVNRIAQVEAANPLTQPVTAIYSRRDAVVNWKACLDHSTPNGTHVEVGSTHLSMGVDADVWQIIALRLANAAEGWDPR